MTLQPIPSEFPYIWGKFSFLFYQCTDKHYCFIGYKFRHISKYCNRFNTFSNPLHPCLRDFNVKFSIAYSKVFWNEYYSYLLYTVHDGWSHKAAQMALSVFFFSIPCHSQCTYIFIHKFPRKQTQKWGSSKFLNTNDILLISTLFRRVQAWDIRRRDFYKNQTCMGMGRWKNSTGALYLPFYGRIFLALSATALKKYKMEIFKPKLKLFEFFGLLPNSPNHSGLICKKTRSRITLAWAPLRTRRDFQWLREGRQHHEWVNLPVS